MNKTLKTSLVLLSTVFALAACGQNSSAGTAAETTQVAQETTTTLTTQANIKESDHESSDNKQSNNNLPKDGQQTFKRDDKGGSTLLIYFFKDDIVYKQIGIYFYNPKGLGKSEEEVVQLLNQSQSLYEGVAGINSTVKKKNGEYIQTVIYDYQTMDWKALHRRDPNQFPATKPSPLNFSEVAAKLQEKGYVKVKE